MSADFTELNLVKQAEERSIKNIQDAEKRGEMLVKTVEHELINYEKKAISDLNAKLGQQYQIEETKAKARAKEIKAEGEKEAERLKQDVKPRMPKAIEHIVKSVING